MKFVKEFILKNFKYVILLAFCLVGLYLGGKFGDLLSERDRLHKDLIGKTEEIQRLNDNVANLERRYVTQQQLLERTKKEFGESSSALRGRIKLLSSATYLIRERARRENRSDIVYEGKRIKYVFNEIRYENGPPVGYVLIFDNGRVVSKLYNHEIDVKTAISRDEETGRYDVLSKADYILQSGHLKHDGVNWKGTPYPLEIKGGVAFIDPTEPVRQKKRFHLWAPRYNLGVNFSKDGPAPYVGASLMGYGYSKRDLDFKFLELGVQYEEENEAGLTFAPVLWRPFGDTLPNTYFGPGVSLDKNGQDFYLGVSLGF